MGVLVADEYCLFKYVTALMLYLDPPDNQIDVRVTKAEEDICPSSNAWLRVIRLSGDVGGCPPQFSSSCDIRRNSLTGGMGMSKGFPGLIRRFFVRSGAILLLFFVALSAMALCSCSGQSDKRVVTADCYDYAGYYLEGCEEEVTDYGSSAMVVDSYQGKRVRYCRLNANYDEWIKANRPTDDIEYVCWYIYDSSGENYVQLYSNKSSVCIEVPLRDRSGEYLGADLYLNSDGEYILGNTVTGSTNEGWRKTEIENNSDYYHNQANGLLNSLDYDYFSRFSSSSNSSDRREGDEANESDSSVPSNAIDWTEAHSHVGENVTLVGPIVDVEYASESNGEPTFIDLGAEYPDDSRVTVVIWGEDRSAFPYPPETIPVGKTLYVTGEVYVRNGVCHVKVESHSQIVVA